MPAAGKWKTEIGWETIEAWHEEAGGFTKDGGTLTINEIRRRCIEICGDAPSKGSISPHFNEETRIKIIKRTQGYRSTIRGMINMRLLKWKEKKHVEKEYTEQPDNRFVTVRDLLINRLKDNGVPLMFCDEFVEYWKKNEGLKEVSDTEWRMPCKVCGEELIINPKGKNMELDHIVPKSREGDLTPDNMIPIHKRCNQAKSDMTMEELIDLADKIRRHNG